MVSLNLELLKDRLPFNTFKLLHFSIIFILVFFEIALCASSDYQVIPKILTLEIYYHKIHSGYCVKLPMDEFIKFTQVLYPLVYNA